ncbi:glycoside hydrolase family 97 protein [Hymenobacter terrigena]
MLGAAPAAFAQSEITAVSPDGAVAFRAFVRDKQLSYSVTYQKAPVVEASPIKLTIDGVDITTGVQLAAAQKSSLNETYPWYGAHAQAVNHYNGLAIPATANGQQYTVEVRVFNDGAAFRVVVPGAATAQRVPDEATAFVVPVRATAWYHDMNMHYESVHVKKAIEDIRAGEWAAPPATFKLAGSNLYLAITEAALQNYSGMALQSDGKRGLVVRLANNQRTSYPYKLRYSPEDTARLAKPAVVTGTITTPWRVMIVGKDLNAFVNNDVVANLNPGPDKALFPQGIKTDWVKPGRAVWQYLDGKSDGTVAQMKEFSKMAAQLGFEHNILEGFWNRWSDEEVKDLVAYSRQLNVGIWVWKHSKGLADTRTRQDFFRRCHDLGIAGVKIDFFDHEAKEVIDLYQHILRETAEQHLLVDFHGANKPTGLARTWPNALTSEAVKGMEASKLENRATHETTIPFTRFIVGPAEYTVVHFGDRRKNTTWAHQIASAAILSAPLLTYAANPANILANPAVEVIKSIPATWDETIVLPGSEIGEVAAFARRKGSTWFISVMNGTAPRKLTIPLKFLGPGSYRVTQVKDVPGSPAAVKMENAAFKKGAVLSLDLGEGGGYVAKLEQ